MRILFMDSYFPGFFRFLAPYVAEQLAHVKDAEIIFLSEYKRRAYQLPNVRHVGIRYPKVAATYPESEQVILNGVYTVEAFAHAMQQLKKEGFYPDIIISTEPCSAEIQEVFPASCNIVYFDLFYDSYVDDILISKGKINVSQKKAMHLRNAFQLSALIGAQKAIMPSDLQRDSFPTIFKDKMTVLPMGVDAKFFYEKSVLSAQGQLNDNIRPELLDILKHKELVTYSSRQISEYAGFSTMCHSIPRVLAARPQSHVVIVTHSVQLAMEHPDCATLMKLSEGRVHILGQFTWNEYCTLLQRTSAHIYMSARPPLPTSLLEAMCCGAFIVASDTKPIRRIIKHKENGLLVDFFNSVAIADMIIYALEMGKEEKDAMRKAAQAFVMENHSAQNLIPQHFAYIMDTYKNMPLETKNRRKQL